MPCTLSFVVDSDPRVRAQARVASAAAAALTDAGLLHTGLEQPTTRWFGAWQFEVQLSDSNQRNAALNILARVASAAHASGELRYAEWS